MCGRHSFTRADSDGGNDCCTDCEWYINSSHQNLVKLTYILQQIKIENWTLLSRTAWVAVECIWLTIRRTAEWVAGWLAFTRVTCCTTFVVKLSSFPKYFWWIFLKHIDLKFSTFSSEMGSDWLDLEPIHIRCCHYCQLPRSSPVVSRLGPGRSFLRSNKSSGLVSRFGVARFCLHQRIRWTDKQFPIDGRMAAIGPHVVLNVFDSFATSTNTGCTGENRNVF